MKQLLEVVVGLFCMVAVAQAEMVAPDVLVKNTAEDVLAIVKQDKDIQSGNQKKVLELVDAKVLPHFDFERMTRLTAGKAWRTATPEQKQALVNEFRNMLIRTYTAAFTRYRDQSVEVKPLKMQSGDEEVTVKTLIVKQGAPSIAVDYEMEKLPGGWKVFDMTVEGASLVATYRNTFATQIQQGGIDGLIKTLVDKNAAAATTPLRKADNK